MDKGRAKELLESGEKFRMEFPGQTKGYKVTQIIEYNPHKQTVDIVYFPPNPYPTPWKFTRIPLEMVEEFEGLWHPNDLKYRGNGSRRTKGNGVGRTQTPEDRGRSRRTRLRRRRTK